MKDYFYLLLKFLLILFFCCPLYAITQGDLVEREGLFYEKFTDVPFSGEVSGEYESYGYYYLDNGAYVKGLKTGIWVSYHENGQLRYKGKFKKGQKIGHWLEYDWLGTKLLDGNYTNGSFKTYTYLGSAVTEGNYLKGKKDGYWIERDVIWKNDRKDGVNNLKKGNYKSGLREGRWEFQMDDGCNMPYHRRPLKDTEIEPDENATINRQQYFDLFGVTHRTTETVCYLVGNYINGKREGKWIVYHLFSNEKLKQQVLGKGSYKNGYKNGNWEYYHLNKNLHSRGKYNFGKMNGPWDFFYENGNLKVKGNFNNENKIDGVWDFFNNDGSFERGEIWKDGIFIISKTINPD